MPPAPVEWVIQVARSSAQRICFIVEASVTSEMSRTNANIPPITIAERIAEMVRQRGTV
jgi:choline dehydrogenase-like flavoprotein